MHVRLGLAVPAPGKYRISAGWVTPAAGVVGAQVSFAGMRGRIDERALPGACGVVWNGVASVSQQNELIDIFAGSEQALDYLEIAPIG